MTFVKINHHLGVKGEDLKFENEDFFDLKVGKKVTQIGDGRENGTIRTDTFTYPVEYCGSIMCQFKVLEKMYAFKVAENIYLLYGSTGSEIFTEVGYGKITKQNGYVRFYAPTFIIHN